MKKAIYLSLLLCLISIIFNCTVVPLRRLQAAICPQQTTTQTVTEKAEPTALAKQNAETLRHELSTSREAALSYVDSNALIRTLSVSEIGTLRTAQVLESLGMKEIADIVITVTKSGFYCIQVTDIANQGYYFTMDEGGFPGVVCKGNEHGEIIWIAPPHH